MTDGKARTWDVPGPEEVLAGGHMNRVVRIGDTVRRVRGPHSAGVHRLLQHTRDAGFHAVPQVLGVDAGGREVLSYIEGDPCVSADRRWLWSDDTLVAAGRLLRGFHDAQAGLELPDAGWSSQARDPTGAAEVLCHNDFAPYNALCRDGELVALIDFDLVAPGSRAWDLAWTAINWVPLLDPADHPRLRPDPPDSRRRLALLCEAYGFGDRAGLVEVILQHLDFGLAVWGERRAAGDPWAVLTEGFQPQWRRARAFCVNNRKELAATD